MRIAISSCAIERLQRAAAAAAPEEGCGLLFGTPGRINDATISANVAVDPLRQFEIDPAALFAALRAERGGGASLIGYWHSHPGGQCAPSTTDAAMAVPDGRLWLILTGDAIGAWRAIERGPIHGRFLPVAIEID